MLFIVLAIISPIIATAQIRYGVVGGIQFSHFNAYYPSMTTTIPILMVTTTTPAKTIISDKVTGGCFGGVAEVDVSEKIAIRPQVLLNFKGGNYNYDGDMFKFNFTYIDLPVHALYKIDLGRGKLLFGAGPYFSFFLAGKGADGQQSGIKLKPGKDIKSFDTGISLMGSYEITDLNLGISIFYNHGFSNTNTDLPEIKNRSFGISVAYFLGEK